MQPTHVRNSPAQRSSRRRSDFRCAGIRSALVWRTNAVSNAIGYAQHYSRSYHAVDFARMIMLQRIETHRAFHRTVKNCRGKMAGDNRSLIEYGYYQGLQRFSTSSSEPLWRYARTSATRCILRSSRSCRLTRWKSSRSRCLFFLQASA